MIDRFEIECPFDRATFDLLESMEFPPDDVSIHDQSLNRILVYCEELSNQQAFASIHQIVDYLVKFHGAASKSNTAIGISKLICQLTILSEAHKGVTCQILMVLGRLLRQGVDAENKQLVDECCTEFQNLAHRYAKSHPGLAGLIMAHVAQACNFDPSGVKRVLMNIALGWSTDSPAAASFAGLMIVEKKQELRINNREMKALATNLFERTGEPLKSHLIEYLTME